MVHRSANIRKLAKDHGIKATDGSTAISDLVRDSSAVRWLFVRLAGAVGRQSALHKENSGFAAPTLGRHISTFRGYRILFSIQIPYINRFTNHFSIHSLPSYPQKVVLHSSTARFSHTCRPYHFVISVSFSTICHVTSRKLWLPQCIMGDDLHIWSYLVQNEKGRT
jgi:hypothetical protein